MATSKSSTKSKAKPASDASSKKASTKPARSAIGAPSQLNQSSRKGKKAWRKNVDIADVEATMEEMRAEERVTGNPQFYYPSALVRHTLPRYSAAQLTSTKILAERSAVPAVFSRTTSASASSAGKRKSVLTREEKERLLRIAKRPRKGPFDSVLDPAEYEAGSGVVDLSAAVKYSGTYDAWVEEEQREYKDGMETVYKPKIKPPTTKQTKDLIAIPAIVEPHQGTSYNPPADAHQELLEKAAAIEQKHLEHLERMAEVKVKMDSARIEQAPYDFSVAPGMTVQEVGDVEDADADAGMEEGEEVEEEGGEPSKKVPERKTKSQRKKAARVLAEKRALAERTERKRMLATINEAKSLRRSTTRENAAREKERVAKRLAVVEKLKTQGLAGHKLGKHKVPEGRVEVQLGEDLSESLRGLKPEGSLFHDRFQSLQQRALIEPRVPVIPKKRRNRIIDYISNYSGRTAIDRLVFIIMLCPAIAPEAFQLCVQRIHRSRDPSLYQHLLQAYEQTAAIPDVALPNMMDLAELDTKWVDDITAENQADRVKLEVELKTRLWDGVEALHQIARILHDKPARPGHVHVHPRARLFPPQLLIEQRNYAHLTTYVFKADAALDAATAASANASASGSAATAAGSAPAPTVTAGSKKRSGDKGDRDNVQAKLDLATALSHLGQGSYEKAAHAFLKIGPAKDLGHWIGKLIAPGDIAIYGTLCALATFPRSTIKTRISENSIFGAYIEQEPYIRELIEAYMNSNFKTVLELLSRYSTRHAADIHLSPHVNDLVSAIRNSAVVLYFQPFATIKLERMSAAFGWTVEEVEYHVVNLIQAGDIQGRVDSQNKILKAKKTDYRDELFARTIKAGAEMQAANRKLLLRMRLQQADLIVKPPKGNNQSGILTDFYAGGE
ncbi:hypothetical protein CVT25_006726 [Psilocybe cyanescens]|uniref:Ribosome biogenesis protein NOP53 n=1 Tax=Psilocybe cyanescens TaxID=93625 RepID=A0A409X489_PSICY|nr:hypothetical protein CVT25_006726 [Psilocybe cyanescens]